ncbi:MAG: hypothetical protein K2F88_02845 [Duncaniella sp.]|nr:hypothetical protein [Duncaniella sp.]
MSEKSRHDSALINTSPGSASPLNPGKTAKTARKALEKRQKQAKSPWKNGKSPITRFSANRANKRAVFFEK